MLLVALALARPPSAGWVDSNTHALRCHFEDPVDEPRCTAVVGYAEHAYDVQVGELGFAPPPGDGPLGGSSDLDIYLGTSASGGAYEAWVDCDGGDGTCTDTDPRDGLARASSFVVIDSRTPDEVMEAYVAHEFNHTLQYGTDYAEPFLSVWEGTAVAAEVFTVGTADVSQVVDYQATPWISAVLQDGYFLDEEYGIWSWYEYGAAAWVLWVDSTCGEGDGTLLPALWTAMSQEGYGTEPDVLDAWYGLCPGAGRNNVADFAAWRAELRSGDDIGPWAGAGTPVVTEGVIDGMGSYSAENMIYPLGMAVWELAEPACVSVAPRHHPGAFEVRYLRPEPDVPSTGFTTGCPKYGAVAVVYTGPDDFDADDPLEPIRLTLDVTNYSLDPPTPACGCGASFASAPLLGLAALASRRGLRRRSPGGTRR